MQLDAVWACVRLISQTISTLPFPLYQKNDQGQGTVALAHPLYNILHDQPNGEMTATEFWGAIVSCILLWGNAYAEIVRAGGRIIALNPLRPDYMIVRRQEDGSLLYIYSFAGQVSELTEGDMLHIKGFSIDGVMGLSPISQARHGIGSAIAAEETAGAIFRNGMRPSGYVKAPNILSKDQRDLAKDLMERFKGSHNTGSVPLLEGGWEFFPLSVPPEDAQLLQTRSFHVEQICRWFDVPPVMIGHTEKATSWGSGIEQMMLGFLMFALRPHLKRIEQVVRKSLLTPNERNQYFAEFNVEGLLRADSHGRAALYSTLVQNGLRTRNEIRAMDNEPPLPGGDDLTVQSNLIPVELLGQVAKLTADKSIAGAAQAPPLPPPAPPAGVKAFDPSEPRDEIGRWSGSGGGGGGSSSGGRSSGGFVGRAHQWVSGGGAHAAIREFAATAKVKAKDPEVVKSVIATAVNQAIGHYVYTHDYMDSDAVAHAIQHVEVGLAVSKAQARDVLRSVTDKLIALRRGQIGKAHDDEVMAALLAFRRELDASEMPALNALSRTLDGIVMKAAWENEARVPAGDASGGQWMDGGGGKGGDGSGSSLGQRWASGTPMSLDIATAEQYGNVWDQNRSLIVLATHDAENGKTTIHGVFADANQAAAERDRILQQKWDEFRDTYDSDLDPLPEEYPDDEQAATIMEEHGRSDLVPEAHKVDASGDMPGNGVPDNVYALHEGNSDTSVTVHGVFSNRDEAVSSQEQMLRQHWAIAGDTRSEQTDQEVSAAARSWNKIAAPADRVNTRSPPEHGDNPKFDEFIDANYPLDGLLPFPGTREANKYFVRLGHDHEGRSRVVRVTEHQVRR